MTAEPRDVEGRCGFTIIDKDGMEQPCERPATGWRWYQDCDHEDTLDVACDRHENEGGRRLRAADETLAAVGALAEEWRAYQQTGFYPEASAHANAIENCGDALADLLADRAALAEGASR